MPSQLPPTGQESTNAKLQLAAKRNLTCSPRSKAVNDIEFKDHGYVRVFLKRNDGKGGKLLQTGSTFCHLVPLDSTTQITTLAGPSCAASTQCKKAPNDASLILLDDAEEPAGTCIKPFETG